MIHHASTRGASGPRQTSAPARGFSLIEVLVSMFVVSMGILALSGLLHSAARYGKMSELRSSASLLANDIADHIRANAQGASSYVLADTFPNTLPNAPANNCQSPSVCLPAGLAAQDMYAWRTRLRDVLPNGSAYIKWTNQVPNTPHRPTVDVWVSWTDPNVVATGKSTERPASECPNDASYADTAIRCVYLQVGL
jgi:type IV pilus assembly protein PilV